MYKLNLGPFNRCVDYLPKGSSAIYSADRDTKVFCYSFHGGDIVEVLDGDYRDDTGAVCVEVFQVGCTTDGYVDDHSKVAELITALELKIVKMIYRIMEVSNTSLCVNSLSRIHIPVTSIQFHDNDLHKDCYGWVELGIAVMVPKEVAVDAIP